MAQNFKNGKKFVEYHGEEKIKKGIELYQQNVSLRKIQEILGLPRGTFSQYLTSIGVKTTVGNHYRQYFHDFDYFETIDTEHKAYWLGFIYADGYIRNNENQYGEKCLGISISIEDKNHLEKFKKDIKATNPIKEYPAYSTNYQNSKGTCRLLLRSEKTAQDLIAKGVFLQKTQILEFPTPDQVPQELIPHFIRGYFDGDGCITSRKEVDYYISFVGTQNMVENIRKNFPGGGNVFPDKRSDFAWIYSVGGNLQILKAYHYMYDEATIYLDRKYEKFQKLVNKYAEKQGINE